MASLLQTLMEKKQSEESSEDSEVSDQQQQETTEGGDPASEQVEAETEVEAETAPEVEEHEGPVYKGLFLHQYHLANGTKIKAQNGFYYPKSQEELDILEHMITKDRAIRIK